MFCCPMCHGSTYEPLMLPLAYGRDRDTGMFQCCICRFGFYDPARYGSERYGAAVSPDLSDARTSA